MEVAAMGLSLRGPLMARRSLFLNQRNPRMAELEEAEHQSFGNELWADELRPFFLHFTSDFIRTSVILIGLYLFWEIIRILRLRGYPDELLGYLEKAHFASMFAALCVTGINFVIKQIVILWRKNN